MYELTRSQKQIQKAARDFSKGEFDKDLAMEMDEQHQVPCEILASAVELGFLGIQYETEYSGGGMGLFENALIAEELCRKDCSIGSALMLSVSGAEALLRFGSKEQKQKFLPGLADGDLRFGAAFNENGMSGLLSAGKTIAVKKDDGFLINGDKRFVIHGSGASLYIVLCRVLGDDGTDQGPCLILVEAQQGGVQIKKAGDTVGLCMTSFSDLCFENVKVPLSNLIGKQGKGLEYAKSCMDETRILIAAIALGTAQGALDRAIDYVKQREQFGRKIARFEVTRQKIADMAVQVESARLFTYHAAKSFDKKQLDPKVSFMAKIVSTSAAVEVADEAIQLLGGYGYMKEYEVERFYRDAKALNLLLGSGQVQKNSIAEKVIGRI